MKRKNFGHRGARSLAPENTMPAISTAWEAGADGVEVDVRTTADGELVLFHDNLLTRTTNIEQIYPKRAHCPLHTFTFAELQVLDAGSWFKETDPFAQIESGTVDPALLDIIDQLRIPRLLECLNFIKEKDWCINLELKSTPESEQTFPPAEAIISLLRAASVSPNSVSIASFNHDYLRAAHQLAPEYEINALIGENPIQGNDWNSFEFAVYNANADYIDRQQVSRAHEQGCVVNLYTVNELDDMQRYLGWGIRSLITDFPHLLAALDTA